MNTFNLHWKTGLFASLISVLALFIFVHQIYMSGGNAYNNYQFLSSDGIDWVVEGHYIWESLKNGGFPFKLHVLRPPVYVIFSTLDAMLGGKGYIFALVSSSSMVATIYYSLKFIGNTKPSLAIYVTVFILLILSPINYFRLFFQADPLATAITLAACWHLYYALSQPSNRKQYFIAIVLVALAALTQTYGLIAPAVLLGVYTLNKDLLPALYKLKNKSIIDSLSTFAKTDFLRIMKKGSPIIIATLLFITLKFFWVISIPHDVTPKNFGLITFNPEMLIFYKMTWGYYLTPIVILIIGMCFWKRVRQYLIKDTISISMIMIALVFMGLLILYNWKDARFTYYFWPYLIILFIRLSIVFLEHSRIINGVFLFLAVTVILSQTLHFYPQNYTSPDITKLNTTAVKKRQSFIKRFQVSGHVDRLSLKKTCGDKINVCKDAKIGKGETKYRTKTHTVYLKLNGISNPQKEK